MEATTVIMKQFRDGEFHTAMASAIQLRKSGAIGRDGYNAIFKHAAAVAYPLAKQAEAERQFILIPMGMRMLNEGLQMDHAEMQKQSAATDASLVAKAKKPKVHLEQPDDGDGPPDDDPDGELKKLGEKYRRAHPAAKLSPAAAIAYAAKHDPDGQRLVRLSKQKNLDQYGSKFAGFFDKAQSAVSRTPPPPNPDVVRDPADRADFDAGQAAIDDGHRTPDGGTFNDKVKQLMTEEGLSQDEAFTRLYRAERLEKLGW